MLEAKFGDRKARKSQLNSGTIMVNVTKVSEEIPPKDSSILSFASAFTANLFLGFTALLLFSLFRRRFKHVYVSNFILHSTKLFSELSETQMQTLNRLKLSNSFFSWLMPSFRVSDEDLYDFAGLDIFVYLRFVRLCLKFSVAILPYGLLVLLPLNTSGRTGLEGMATLTLGNLELKSDKLWAHLVGVWLYSLFIYYLLYKEWLTFIHYRQIYLRKGYEEQYSILVMDLPTKFRNDRNFSEFMNSIFPEKIISVHVIKNLTKWLEMIENHDETLRKYEHSQALYKKYRKRPYHKKFVIFGTKYDSITFYENKLKEMNDEMILEKDKNHLALSSAIVTFRSLQDAAVGLQTCWNSSPFTSFVSPAPASSDIIWENIKLPKYIKSIRYIIVCVALFFLVFFWSTPVLIVSSMVSLHSLQRQFSFLNGVNDLPPLVKGIIEGFLATIVLEVFFSILPDLMALLARTEGINSRSQAAISCIGKLFIFQIVNKFLGVLFGGALLSRLSDIIKSPTQIPQILAESMPSMANFFINVIMLRSLSGFPMEILQLFRVLKVSILRKWFCKTLREDDEAWKPPPVRYPGMFAINLFMFIVGIAYSVLSPLVVVFVAIYFGLAYIIRFYMLLYVSRSSYQSGGLMWPKVFNRMITGIFVFQFLMIGVFALKENALVSLFCLPLPALTLIFFRGIHNHFDRSTLYLNLSMAKEISIPLKTFLETSSQKYNRTFFLPDMFALSTDKPTKSGDGQGPSGKYDSTSKTSLVDVGIPVDEPMDNSNDEEWQEQRL